MQKKSPFTKTLLSTAKRFFHSRNVIIISEHKVGHVPLSGVMQVLIFVGFLGFFSGVSYITGSYMAARNAITERDKKLASTTIEKRQISQEMGVLKRDLMRLSENGNELDAYSKFIISQHNNLLQKNGSSDLTAIAPKQVTEGNLFGQNTGQLLDRISFLETRINEIKNENEHLVLAIRERTDNKINYLEDVISMTGLDADRIERMQTASESGKGAKKTRLNAGPEESAKKDAGGNEGGPYIPYNETFLNSTEQSLITDVDRLVALHDIVMQLPLNQPLKEWQQMSPFGKRVDPFNHRWSMHPGIDMRGASGSRVLATNAGVVIDAGRKPAYGNMVDIEHKYGIITRYAHMSKLLVKEGDKISKGQVIGIQGSTGRSTGEHLHYEVRINDHPVNPINFLHAGEYVLEN